MRYTNRTIIVSQSRIVEAERRVRKQRRIAEALENARHPADHAVALLLVMEQSLLSMKRFLATLEADLSRSLGLGKPKRAARKRSETRAGQTVQQVAAELRSDGPEADRVPVSTVPEESGLPVGKQDEESASQVADEFAALAVKVVISENPDLPVLSVIAKVRPQPPRTD
jgi:hypothetical protein